MNRILRRPMFRKGGSTENQGIMDGMRQRFSEGKFVQELKDRVAAVNKLAPSQPASLNNFLIDFGLDLMSRSPQGNVLQTAASSARGPFQRFQQQRAQEVAANRNLVGSLAKGIQESRGKTSSQLLRAQELYRSGATDPRDGKPYDSVKDALEYVSLSAADPAKLSIEGQKKYRRSELGKENVMGEQADKIIQFEFEIKPMMDEKLPGHSGMLPTSGPKRRQLLLETASGAYFFDPLDGLVKQWVGYNANGQEVWDYLDQKTFESKPDAEEREDIQVSETIENFPDEPMA